MTFQHPPGPLAQTKGGTIPLHRNLAGLDFGSRHWSSRFRVQIPVLAGVVLGAQLIALFILTGTFSFQLSAVISIVFTQFANLVSAFLYRAIQRVPGTRKLAIILPTISASYAVLIVTVLITRAPYSLWLIAIGYIGALITLWVFNSRRAALPARRLSIIESELTDELIRDLPQVPLFVLEDPQALRELANGAVIVDLRKDLSTEWEREIARAVLRGVPVYHVKQAYESLTGKVRFDHLSENHFGSLVPSLGYLAIKRAMDVVVAAIALTILLLPMLAIAIVIRLNSSGPAIFSHTRVGYRGQAFQAYKFRTMEQRDHGGDNRDSQITLENDPRITTVGRFLRQTRLDELPQLFNVLCGQMSLIGPRPEALALSEWYYDRLDFYEYRHIIRPGITGWAQINQGHVTSLEDIYHKTQYDFYYIKNVSLSLDFLIALKTLEIMFTRRGAR